MQKTQDDKYLVPRPYDISGSAHWYNRADNCLSVWRDVGDEQKRHDVEIHVQKVRNKYVGTVGMTTLLWDSVTGRLTEKGGAA
jgi:twinkle protein